jgi:hypothetical protein
MAEAQPSGVRLVFRTEASVLELDVLRTRRVYLGAPPRPDGIYEPCVDGQLVAQASARQGKVLTIDMATGSVQTETGAPDTLRFANLATTMKTVEIWLPHNETTELIALRGDAQILPVPSAGERVWRHHGSSISHGSDAASPTGTWPARAASIGGMALINLGFSGSALLDPFVARTMRDTPADLISLKIGINLVNTDLMRLRAFKPAVHGFLDTLRDGHPTTPIVLISPILCPMHEDTPGPTLIDTTALSEGRLRFSAAGNPAEQAAGKLTLRVIRAALQDIVRQRSADDANLHYLDGLSLYGEADLAALPLPDELRPDAATHRHIGERFAKLVVGRDGMLGRRVA